MRRLRGAEVDLRIVHDYGNSHFRPLTDGCATLSELFEIRWNDFRGAYGNPALDSKILSESVSSDMNLFQESTTLEHLEVPANSSGDDLAA
jgi:hypothetical protein